MTETLLRTGKDEVAWMNEKSYITEFINTEAIPDFSLALTRVKPGVVTELHRLTVSEWYVVIEGNGQVEVDGGPATQIGPGDTVVIPAGVSQRLTNTGDSDLLLENVCLPRYTPDCYDVIE